MSNVAALSLIGSTLGAKYVIEALIGEGAMGSVYRAHQTSLQKTVAIKVLHRQLADQPAFIDRFKREAFSASRLDHPNSLRVLDFGESDGLLYLVMEFAQGEDLLTVMEREWPFDDRRIIDVMSQALVALATAHDLGIVHRDLKPENILLLHGSDDEGKPTDVVKVCDFGIAKLMVTPAENARSFSRRLTTEGFVVGTPDYMSPEQARGQDVDRRSDLYSMGVVLYQMLAGVLPFIAETPLGVALMHISDPPPPPSSHHKKVHARLEAICMRALSKNPSDRFENAREMRRAIRGALELDGEPMPSTPAPTPSITDMTSVPAISNATPMFHTGLRAWLVRRGLRLPTTPRGRAIAYGSAVLAFGAVALAPRLVSTSAPDTRPVVAATTETVLTTPPPALPDPTIAPERGASAPIEEPAPAARNSDRAELKSDRHRTEKTSSRSNSGSTLGANGGGAPEGRGLTAPASAQANSAPFASTDTTRSASPASESAARPIEPPPRPSSVQTATAAPIAEPAPPPATLDPAHASVVLGNITTTGGISAIKVRAAIARVPFTSCYRKSLANRTSASPMEATLRITVDMTGRVNGAALSSDGNLTGLRACIESEVRGQSIRDVDTGDGSASITLMFSPR